LVSKFRWNRNPYYYGYRNADNWHDYELQLSIIAWDTIYFMIFHFIPILCESVPSHLPVFISNTLSLIWWVRYWHSYKNTICIYILSATL
jgi:hypothetical protein